jgi:hypothetical protein
MIIALILIFLGSIPAFGQDDAAAAAMQQAQQQAIQANQQAIDSMQQLSQQTTINNLQMQLNMADASSSNSNSGPIIGIALQPTFSVKPGEVSTGTQLRIKTATHYATIYYTTDGWTPTRASTRYTGPIPINSKTHFQAMAIGPNLLHSPIARADYTVTSTAAASPVEEAVLVTDGVLHAGTRLRLTTSSIVSSQTAEVGDKVPLLLDQDVKTGDTVFAAKGTPVDAVLTIADPAAKRNLPGDLVFKVLSLNVPGMPISLLGGQTLEGVAGRNPKEAVIEPGMIVFASVASDTTLKP